MHELDAALARGEVPNPAKGLGPIRLRPLLSFLVFGALQGRAPDPAAWPRSGRTPTAPRSTCRAARSVTLVPGHTPGSAVLHVPSLDALFVGDAIATKAVTTGETGPMIAPFTADPAMALQSLDRLEGIEAGWLLPGHGEPWTGGVAAALDRVRARAAAGAA